MTQKHGRNIKTIWVHCASTRPEWMEGTPLEDKVAEITQWHKKRGFSAVGYHYIVDRDGAEATGRQEAVIGAHVLNHNHDSIGICLLGGHGASKSDPFDEHFTAAQDMALRERIAEIQSRFPGARVRGHSEVANKACPGFLVQPWLDGKDTSPSIISSSTTIKNATAGVVATGAIAAEHGAGVVSETLTGVRNAWGPDTTMGTLAEAAKGDAKWLLIFVLVGVLCGVIISRLRAAKEGKIG